MRDTCMSHLYQILCRLVSSIIIIRIYDNALFIYLRIFIRILVNYSNLISLGNKRPYVLLIPSCSDKYASAYRLIIKKLKCPVIILCSAYDRNNDRIIILIAVIDNAAHQDRKKVTPQHLLPVKLAVQSYDKKSYSLIYHTCKRPGRCIRNIIIFLDDLKNLFLCFLRHIRIIIDNPGNCAS